MGIPAAVLNGLPISKREWLIHPLIAENTMTLLQGSPKGGKSVFSLYVALCIAKGIWTAGRFEVPKPRRVVYLAYEDDFPLVHERLIQYNTGLQLGPLPENLVIFEHPPLLDMSTSTGPDRLKKIIELNKADVVFLDTFRYTHSLNEKENQDMQAVMEAYGRVRNATGCAQQIIHHTRKEGSGGDQATMSERSSGASNIPAAAQTIIHWGKRPDGCHVTPCSLTGKLGVQESFSVEYIKGKFDESLGVHPVTWKIDEAVDFHAISLERALPTLKTLTESFAQSGEPATARFLASITGASPTTVGKYLETLLKSGRVSVTEGQRGSKLWKPV